MFIRAVKKKRKNSDKVFIQYSLCQSARVDGKSKQYIILYLGSEKELADKTIKMQVLALLKSKIQKLPTLDIQKLKTSPTAEKLADKYYQKYLIKYEDNEYENVTSIPPSARDAEFHNVDIKTLQVEDVKTFGAEHLCKQVMDKLNLRTGLKNLGFKDTTADRALIAIIARAIFTASEHKTAQYLNTSSALYHCFNYKKTLDHKQLYDIADKLFAKKKELDIFLNKQINQLFDLEDKMVIFDISNTYFETSKKASELAKYGRSKEKRYDCPLVVFAASINSAGFITYSKIYKGNSVDSALLSDMLIDLEANNAEKGKDKTVVIDAGIATDDNLELINSKGYKYVCVARKKLKKHPIDEKTEFVKMETDRGRQSVKLKVIKQDQDSENKQNDIWMYVSSPLKLAKENAISEKIENRLIEQLENIQQSLSKKGGTKKIPKVWERIGRAKEKNKKVAHLFEIKVEEKDGIAIAMSWSKKQPKSNDKSKNHGVYFIRTNYDIVEEKQLWDIYNTIRDVEATFRCLKTDLGIRPVHHQKDDRIKSHIYLTILAYQLVNTIRRLLKNKNINHDWKNILRIMNTQTLQTVVMPTDKKKIHLCTPSKPIDQAKEIYDATKCIETQKAIKKFVVYH